MGRLKERERQLEAELRAARASSTGRAELDDETVAKMLGEETLARAADGARIGVADQGSGRGERRPRDA